MSVTLPFTVAGRIVHGKRLGTELGFPTANLDYPVGMALPPNGIYVAEAETAGRRYPAVLSQGKHPTVPEGPATIETHLLDYVGGDLYGRDITITYLRYLRPELRFNSLEELKTQMAADKAEALRWYAENR